MRWFGRYKEPLGSGLQVLIQGQLCTNAKHQAWRTERIGFPCSLITQECSLHRWPCRSLFPALLATPSVFLILCMTRGCLRTRALATAPSDGWDHLRLMCMDTVAFLPCVHLHLASKIPVHRHLHHDLDLRAPWPSAACISPHDSWSTQTPTSFGLSRVSPSVRLISFSTWRE